MNLNFLAAYRNRAYAQIDHFVFGFYGACFLLGGVLPLGLGNGYFYIDILRNIGNLNPLSALVSHLYRRRRTAFVRKEVRLGHLGLPDEKLVRSERRTRKFVIVVVDIFVDYVRPCGIVADLIGKFGAVDNSRARDVAVLHTDFWYVARVPVAL